MSRREWTGAERRRLLDMTAQRVPDPEIARRLGRTKMAIQQTRAQLRREGRDADRGVRCDGWSPEEEARMLALIASGLSAREAGRRLGRTMSAVHSHRQVMRERGVDFPRAPAGRRPEDLTWRGHGA